MKIFKDYLDTYNVFPKEAKDEFLVGIIISLLMTEKSFYIYKQAL